MSNMKKKDTSTHKVMDVARANTLQVGFPQIRRKTLPMGSGPQAEDINGKPGKGAPIVHGGTLRSGRKNDDFTNIYKSWLADSHVLHTTLNHFDLKTFIACIARAASMTPKNGRGYVEIQDVSGKRYRAYVMVKGESGVEVPKDEVDQTKNVILRINDQFWFVFEVKEKK